MKKTKQFIIGAVVAVLAIYFTFRNVSVQELLDSFSDVNFIYLIPSGILVVVSFAIRGVRWKILLSPIIRTNCRYQPSCSEYAIIALKEHGLLKGTYLFILRILKCNPFGGHGHDPVPKKTNRRI